MKKLSTYLFLVLFSFQTPSWADDIRDFQIEGMSIGDSLLDYFTEEKIKDKLKDKKTYYYKNNKYATIGFNKISSDQIYERIVVTIKPKDNKYIIYEIRGEITFHNNIDDCLDRQKIITNEISQLFKNLKFKDRKVKHGVDKTGKSIVYSKELEFENKDEIRIGCLDWSAEMTKKNNWKDGLWVLLASDELLTWVTEEAFK